VEVSGVEL